MSRQRRRHPGPLSLTAFIGDALPPRLHAVVMRHVASCIECRRQVSVATAFARGIGDDDPYEAVRDWVDAYLAAIPDHRWPSVVAYNKRLQHTTVARHLSARADGLYYRDPHLGLMYAMTATVIYEHLVASDQPVAAELRTAAWRDQASFMLRCGRLSEYEQAIERAYELANDADDPEYERAVLDLSRGIAFSEPDIGRLEEAIELLESCAKLLASRGDVRRARLAVMRRGDALMASSDVARAGVVFELLLAGATEAERPHIMHRLAWCASERGEHVKALQVATEARDIFNSRGEVAARAVLDSLIGEVLTTANLFDEAVETLERTERDLSTLGMTDVWVSVRLARVAALLGSDPSADIRELCEEAAEISVALDQREPSRRHQRTAEALDFLRQNAQRQSLTFDAVKWIGAYVRRASMRPIHRFVAPPGMAIM